MRRTTRVKSTIQIPDAINCVRSENFTRVPNDMLRNPELSAKAKGILCLLLSNREGWKSHVDTITKMMADGKESIRSGLNELEEHGYLLRIRYREMESKQLQGMVWCYTDSPGEFNLDVIMELMRENGLEAQLEATTGFSSSGFSSSGSSSSGKPAPNKTNRKKTNEKNILRAVQTDHAKFDLKVPSPQRPITPSMFDKFWSLYPQERRIKKGQAQNKWNQLCRKSPKDRPTWKEIKSALLAQKKTDWWQNPKYIPLPTTWLNQQRWLDDPARMTSFGFNQQAKSELPSPQELMKEAFGDLLSNFERTCYQPAKDLFRGEEGIDSKLAESLVNLYEQIRQIQNPKLSGILPGPTSLISHYIEWLRENDWIKHRDLRLFDIDNNLFRRFCRDEAKKDNLERDPISGRSYLGE